MLYNIFPSTNRNFAAVWADPTSSINTGKVYTCTTGANASFFVIDVVNKVVCDLYTINQKGGFGERLDQENTIDINVSSAV